MLEVEFCRDELWNSSISWNTDNPNLSGCLQNLVHTVLCSLYIGLFPCWMYSVMTVRGGQVIPLPRGGNWGKFLISSRMICSLICSICSIILPFLLSEVYMADVLSAASISIACFIAIASELVMLRWLKHTSMLNTCFWFFLMVCLTPGLKIALEGILVHQEHDLKHSIQLIRWSVAAMSSLLQVFSNTSVLPEDALPRESASAASFLIMGWFTDLICKGWKSPLVMEDIPDLQQEVKARKNAEIIISQLDKDRMEGKRFVLWKTLLKNFTFQYWVGILLLYIRSVIVFCNPALVRMIIQFVNSEDEPQWRGYLYAVILFLSNFVALLLSNHAILLNYTSANLMRSATISAVYRKSLRLSNAARQKFTTGEIINLMSVDAKRLLDNFIGSDVLLVAPPQLIFALVLIYYNLGWSVLSGFGVLVLMAPVSFFTSKKAEAFLDDQLKAKDLRIKLMNEILSGIKVLKLYAWELPFMSSIKKIRDGEIRILRFLGYLWSLTSFTYVTVPLMMSMATFFTYTYSSQDRVLTADLIFTTITLFNLIRSPLKSFPLAIMDLLKLIVSVNRLDDFLNADELGESSNGLTKKTENSVEIEDATFTWEAAKNPVLKDLNLEVKHGELVAVVGLVGAGKSSFLSAVLGEMEKLNGSVYRSGRTAYVSQQAWIQNLTVKRNIVFGSRYDEDLYQEVLQRCSLESDLKKLPAGDATEIGENGINLSGGQKQRVALARAIYQRADIYLLDDPLAALDAHVGAAVFKDAISNNGILAGTTRILVTHNLAALKYVDRIILLRKGEFVEIGTYKDLSSTEGPFSEFLKVYNKELGEKNNDISKQTNDGALVLTLIDAHRSLEKVSQGSPTLIKNSLEASKNLSINIEASKLNSNSSQDGLRQRKKSTITESSEHLKDKGEHKKEQLQKKEKKKSSSNRLTQDEKALTGTVEMRIYAKYIQAMGVYVFCFYIVLCCICQALLLGTNGVLTTWSDDQNRDDASARDFYMTIYGCMGVTQTVIFLSKEIILYLACAKASRLIHEQLLNKVMHSPMSFFDTNPMGRILNRFSSDVDSMDQTFPAKVDDFLNSLTEVIGIVAVIIYSTPSFLALMIPISILYYPLQKLYLSSSRQIRRLEMISKSPIFSQFSETITGAASIRAFGLTERFQLQSESLVDKNVRCTWSKINANRWLGIRLQSLGNLILLFSAVLATASRGNISAGMAGFSVSYSLLMTRSLYWIARMFCSMETNMICLERIFEYSEKAEEADWYTEEDNKLPKNWPLEGRLDLKRVSVSYRKDLPPVLEDLSINIRSGEKIGVCGRTGAGKSTLSLVLFRIMETSQGCIMIDGVDIRKLGLQKLRSRITIIPQDPVLFSSSLRFNIDPSSTCTDLEVKRCLRLAGLAELTDNIEQEVLEKGENYSVGQRQLICLARALLRDSKLLILDEATAAVDVETDNLVQKTIREQFRNCTVLTIAHRLNTIMDSDRVLVLDKGFLQEFEQPDILLKNPDSIFHSLAKESCLV